MQTYGRLLLLSSLLALPAQSFAADPACTEQVAALTKWLDLAKADKTRGVLLSARVDKLVAVPIRKSDAPKETMMTLLVQKNGVSEKVGALSPIENAKSVIESNPNFMFARQNKNAIAHGILVGGEADAPAASVKKVLAAAVASGEKVWLLFRPSDAKITAPPSTKLGEELAKIGHADMMAVVEIIRREFGPCEGLMGMMQKMGGQTMETRLGTLISAPPAAVKECSCKTSGPTVAALLWAIAFRDLGVVVPVSAAKVDALPWGDAKASWADVAPGIAKAL